MSSLQLQSNYSPIPNFKSRSITPMLLHTFTTVLITFSQLVGYLLQFFHSFSRGLSLDIFIAYVLISIRYLYLLKFVEVLSHFHRLFESSPDIQRMSPPFDNFFNPIHASLQSSIKCEPTSLSQGD